MRISPVAAGLLRHVDVRRRMRASLYPMGIDNPVHLLFIAIVALVVLGPKRLPEMTRALGHGIREFRDAINGQAQPEAVQTEVARPQPEQSAASDPSQGPD